MAIVSKSHIAALSAAILLSQFAAAEGNSCFREVKAAVEKCRLRISSAKSSDVSAMSSDSMNSSGEVQARAATLVGGRLSDAANACAKEDQPTCTRACNSALKVAQSQRDQAAMKAVSSQMNYCTTSIENEMKQAAKDYAALNSFATESNYSSTEAGGTGCAECGEDAKIIKVGAADPNGRYTLQTTNGPITLSGMHICMEADYQLTARTITSQQFQDFRKAAGCK